MSYEIFYDRRFIKVSEDGYIPMVQMGSSNIFEYYAGKMIPEKRWFVFDAVSPNRIIFSREEIMQAAELLEEDAAGDMIMKTRYTPFKAGEIKKWFKSGIKNAKSLEEYISWGNTLQMVVRIGKEEKFLYPKTTEELINEITMYQISGIPIKLQFEDRKFIVPRKYREKKRKTLEEYPYVIETGIGYFHHKGKWTLYTTIFPEYARKFKTEKEAIKYIQTYELPESCKVVCMKKEKYEQTSIFTQS